jgi:hypothetical protein
MENLGIFYDHLVYFTAIGNIVWPFGICCCHFVYFPRFGILYHEKSGNPARHSSCPYVGFYGFQLINLQHPSLNSMFRITNSKELQMLRLFLSANSSF